jgi:hypothetical protein
MTDVERPASAFLPPPEWGAGAPPISWFNENIVHYLQVQEEMDFLHHVLSFVQRLQHERLISTAAQKNLLGQVPKGTAEEVMQKTSAPPLQEMTKQGLLTLQELVALFQAENPQLAKELAPFNKILQSLLSSMPQVKEEQLNALRALLENLEKHAATLSPQGKKAFWEKVSDYFAGTLQSSQDVHEEYSQFLSALQGRQALLKDLLSMLQNFQQLSSDATTYKQFSPAQLQQLVEIIQDLGTAQSQLPKELQEKVLALLAQLKNVKGSEKQKLLDLLAHTLVQQAARHYLETNPQATWQSVQNYLRQYFAKSPLAQLKLPFLEELMQKVGTLTEEKDPKNLKFLDKAYFAKAEERRVEPNLRFEEEITELYEFDPDSWQGGKKSADALAQSAAGLKTEQDAQSEGVAKTLKTMEEVSKTAHKSTGYSAMQSMMSGSLPCEFKKIILDYYMKHQQEYLQALAELLYFSNMATGIGNNLLETISNFQNAATTFNFANQVTGSGGQYNGTVSQYKALLEEEKKACAKTMTAIDDELNKIRQEEDKIKGDKSLTTAQKKELLDKLDPIKKQLLVAHENVMRLNNDLKVIQIKPGADSSHFTISPPNWRTYIGQDEYRVINGDSSVQPSGSLTDIYGDVRSITSYYSLQTTQNQMTLQMNMTEVQQQWTITGTGFQILWQIYMTLAKAIFGR